MLWLICFINYSIQVNYWCFYCQLSNIVFHQLSLTVTNVLAITVLCYYLLLFFMNYYVLSIFILKITGNYCYSWSIILSFSLSFCLLIKITLINYSDLLITLYCNRLSCFDCNYFALSITCFEDSLLIINILIEYYTVSWWIISLHDTK